MGPHLSRLVPGKRQRAAYNPIQDPQTQERGPSTEPHPNEQITSQNTNSSALHALPTELLLEIVSYLGIRPTTPGRPELVPRMALRATCRRFQAIIPGPPAPKNRWSNWDRLAYSHLLKQARFRELCARERDGQLTGNGRQERLVCCICQNTHPRGCFTPVELKQEPKKRICIGSQGVVIICPHTRLTFLGLKRTPVNITCLSCRWAAKSYAANVKVEEQKNGDVTIEVSIEMGDCVDECLEERLEQVLQAASWRLCPHLHTKVANPWLPVLLTGTAASAPQTLIGRFLHRLSTWFCRKPIERWPYYYSCEADVNCDTRITLIKGGRKATESRSSFTLKIVRNLGPLSDGAGGRKWMTQIVEASRLEDDRFLE